MQVGRDEITGKTDPFARYPASTFSTVQAGLVQLMVEKRVGRNGWAVMVALCRKVYADGRLGRTPAAELAKVSGLTAYQVARGMKELRDKGIIAPVIRKTAQGYRHPDRSNYGHVAQYRFTKKAWARKSPCALGHRARFDAPYLEAYGANPAHSQHGRGHRCCLCGVG